MKKVSLIVLLTLVAATALAQAKPDAMLKQVEWFAANYQCSGIAYANPMAPEHATRATVTGAWTLDGHWVRFTYAEKKTAQNPSPFAVSGFFGYDPQMKKVIVGAVDNMGGRATGASDGWNGDSIVFTGPWHMHGQTFNSRDTFTKTGPNEMKHLGEIEVNGTWTRVGQETCKKSKK